LVAKPQRVGELSQLGEEHPNCGHLQLVAGHEVCRPDAVDIDRKPQLRRIERGEPRRLFRPLPAAQESCPRAPECRSQQLMLERVVGKNLWHRDLRMLDVCGK
jgi:hypothetical protein